MGAPKGSKNAAGNKGGGRKSAYQEYLDAQKHYQAWTQPQDLNALVKRIKSRKYSVWDVFVMRALKADPRILAKFADKIMPDLTMLMGPGGGAIEIDLLGEAEKRAKVYEEEDDEEEPKKA